MCKYCRDTDWKIPKQKQTNGKKKNYNQTQVDAIETEKLQCRSQANK